MIARSPILTRDQFLAAAAVLACAVLLQAAWMPLGYLLLLLGGLVLRAVQRSLVPKPVHAAIRVALILVLLWASWTLLSPSGQRAVFGGLLASMLSLKLLETERLRDARIVVAFGCFLAMTGFLFEQGPMQSLATALFVLLAFSTLYDLVPGRPVVTTGLRLRRAVRYGVALVALAVPFALAVFVLFPRLDRPLWSGSDEARVGRTGLSNRLEPGQLSALALDDTPVFRVTFDGALPPPDQRYFRGQVFWYFDGRGWGYEGDVRDGAAPLRIEPIGPVVEYTINMLPTDQRWLFLLDTPLAAHSFSPRARGGLGNDRVFRMLRPIDSPMQVRASSAPSFRMVGELGLNARNMALALPGSMNPRSRALARSWREKHPGDDRAVVREALAMYNAGFTYSLDPPLLASDPVDDFLFESRIGFCEHFASSFAFLMRGAGIPARVIGGYLGGYYNPAGGFLTVLNSDAHAWVEVWLDGEGWVRVDPTAFVAPERVQRSAREWRGDDRGWTGAVGTTLRDRFDVVGAWWNRAVVQFNAAAQRELFGKLGYPDISPRSLALLMVGAGIATLALALAIGFRTRRRVDPVVAAWHRLCRKLARAGVERAPHEGPVAFAARAAAALPDQAEAIRALSADFVRLRYAGAHDGGDEASAFRRAVNRFRPRRATRKDRHASSP